MTAYRPVFDCAAADFLAQLSKRREHKALALARDLANHPFKRSDYTLPDDTGRQIEYLLVEDFVFGYWRDDAVHEFRIVEIQDAS